jgi:hypothetical protein
MPDLIEEHYGYRFWDHGINKATCYYCSRPINDDTRRLADEQREVPENLLERTDDYGRTDN